MPQIDPPNTAGALGALFARTSRASERVIVPVNDSALDPRQAGPAFYCVHSLSGAGGTDFCELGKLLPSIRFYGIQAPPKKMRDPAFGASVEALADYYATSISTFQPHGMLLLGGWSAGAIIGIEIAQNLRARGREVGLFVAIDAAPENTAAGLRFWHPLYVLAVIRNLPGWMRHDVLAAGAIGSLATRTLNKTATLMRTLTERSQDREVLSGHAAGGFMDLSRYQADHRAFIERLYAALLQYKPRPYQGRVVVYEARVKPLLHLPQVRRIWQSLAPASVVVQVNGTHLSILREAHVGRLADDLRDRLVALQG